MRLGVVTALTLPLLAWLTEVSVDASLSVLGFDAFGAGIELQGTSAWHSSWALCGVRGPGPSGRCSPGRPALRGGGRRRLR